MRPATAVERSGLSFTLIAIALFVAACAHHPAGVDSEVMVCCEAEFHHYATYDLEFVNVPGFLEPYLRGGITPVLDSKGLTSTLDRPDLHITILFDQVFLSPDSLPADYFGEGVEPGDATRFMAAISIDVIDVSSEHIVWSGRLSRIHTDPHGQPRGNDHKMQGIIDGFGEIFADYPIRLTDTNQSR